MTEYAELASRLRSDADYMDRNGIALFAAPKSKFYRECADAIEEQGIVLESYRNRMKAGCDWIPVTERLPEDDQRVLAYYGFDRGDGYLGMMFVQVLDYFARDPRPHFQHEGANGMKVTHWMPLPEPPKEEEHG